MQRKDICPGKSLRRVLMEQIENLDHHKTLRFYFFSKKWRLRRNLLRVKEKFKPRVSFVKKVLRDDEIFIGTGGGCGDFFCPSFSFFLFLSEKFYPIFFSAEKPLSHLLFRCKNFFPTFFRRKSPCPIVVTATPCSNKFCVILYRPVI